MERNRPLLNWGTSSFTVKNQTLNEQEENLTTLEMVKIPRMYLPLPNSRAKATSDQRALIWA